MYNLHKVPFLYMKENFDQDQNISLSVVRFSFIYTYNVSKVPPVYTKTKLFIGYCPSIYNLYIEYTEWFVFLCRKIFFCYIAKYFDRLSKEYFFLYVNYTQNSVSLHKMELWSISNRFDVLCNNLFYLYVECIKTSNCLHERELVIYVRSNLSFEIESKLFPYIYSGASF